MAIQNQPGFIPAPFANSGTKNVIPETMPTPSASAAASWTDGFPTVCSLPLASGGIPPARADFNGLLNWMTQAQAFYQSGGVYEWDATIDYDVQRMVRGSNGLLYWSMAQSGPNTGAGAVDPTTDDGTYWSSPALRTMPLADKSAMGATTEWVKDLAVAPVYLDPAGSDSNDGMTAATAVQTFAKAVQVAKGLPQIAAYIVVAAGSYSGDVAFDALRCVVDLQGNVAVSGDVAATADSRLYIKGNFTFSISGSLILSEGSSFYSATNVKITTADKDRCIDASGANIKIDGTLSVVANDVSGSAVQISNSSAVFNGNVDISGSSYNGGVVITRSSMMEFNGYLKVNNSNNDGGSGPGVSVLDGSHARFNSGGNAIHGIGSYIYGLSLSTNSSCSFYGSVSIRSNSTTGIAVFVDNCSDALFSADTVIDCPAYGRMAVNCSSCSCCIFLGSYTLEIAGTWSDQCFLSIDNALIYVALGFNVTNSSAGQRYYVTRGAQINVGGAGANRIPGSTAGVVDSGSYGFYH